MNVTFDLTVHIKQQWYCIPLQNLWRYKNRRVWQLWTIANIIFFPPKYGSVIRYHNNKKSQYYHSKGNIIFSWTFMSVIQHFVMLYMLWQVVVFPWFILDIDSFTCTFKVTKDVNISTYIIIMHFCNENSSLHNSQKVCV